jgi:DNA topoisomerase I
VSKGRDQRNAHVDPETSAKSAGLRYVTDSAPGFTLIRDGDDLVLRNAAGKIIRDKATLARVRALVLPPAWRDVWIAADPRAHLQATGRDAARRKQYRYHAQWTVERDATKYHRMTAFARALPGIRRRVARDLNEPVLSRAFVLATVVRLIERTHLRIGNEEYAKQNGSHGLTTLRRRHVVVQGSRVRLDFRAKSGVRQQVEIADARIARAVRRCQDLPGQLLFKYVDEDGEVRSLSSSDVNAYLQGISRDSFTAKDFRTWAGTVEAAVTLERLGPADTQKERKRRVVQAVDAVAEALGNTRAVSRKCYIHPAVLAAYERGVTLADVDPADDVPRGLSMSEAGVLAMLEGPRKAHPKAA